MDVSALIAEVSERSSFPGIVPRAEHLLKLAEAEINKRLRVAQQETTDEIVLDDKGNAALPFDFLLMRRAALGNLELRQWALRDIQSKSRRGYAIRGGYILTSEPGSTITLTYYRGLPPLSLSRADWDQDDWGFDDFLVDQSTNWLLESDPEIYIWALLKQWHVFRRDFETATSADDYLSRLLNQRNSFDAQLRFSGVRFRTAGPTP